MRIIQIDINKNISFNIPICACIGYFDGLHLGHQALIKKTIELSNNLQVENALITFDPDPNNVVGANPKHKHLTTMKKRIDLAIKFGIKNVIILKFSNEMANLSYEDFYNRILDKLSIKAIVCGFDFRYGYKAMGNSDTLIKQANFDVHVIDSINYLGKKISSTRIIDELTHNDLSLANSMLGYNYEIVGRIVHGKAIGRKIGFPTINIEPENEFYIPKIGVYAVYVTIDNIKYKGMLSIGINPTFINDGSIKIEAHIFDFNKDVYNKSVIIEFVKYLRNEIKFSNVDNLILQLNQDQRDAKRVL